MAESKCPAPGCGGTDFEAKTKSLPSGVAIALIQCAKCGTVVGAMEYESILPIVQRIEKKVNSLR